MPNKFMSTSAGAGSDARVRALTRVLVPFLGRYATYIVAGLCILLLDFWTGPSLSFPILFVIPVALSAWFCSARLAYALAVLLPFGRFLIAVFADIPNNVLNNAANALIKLVVLIFLAFLVARTARQAREIKILRGLLPICMFCKRIRNEGESWQPLEAYIAEHSEANFSHGLCPDCTKRHYGDLFDTNEKV